MLLRGEPWFYGALRCVRKNQTPGERAFWTRLWLKPAFVRESTGPDGDVTRVVVLLPHVRKVVLDRTLAVLAKDRRAWPDKRGRYVLDSSPYHQRLPAMKNVTTWGEYDAEWGARFIAERGSTLAAVPVGLDAVGQEGEPAKN